MKKLGDGDQQRLEPLPRRGPNAARPRPGMVTRHRRHRRRDLGQQHDGVAVLVKADGSAGAIDRSAPVWTVKVGRLGAPGESLPAPATVNVATAWFASD